MKYHSQGKQLTLDAFRSSLSSLPKSNRWVLMGDTLPWGEIEKSYNAKLNNSSTGAGNKCLLGFKTSQVKDLYISPLC